MIENRSVTIQKAQQFRRDGLSHRQIAKQLKIGLGTAVVFTQNISLTREQHKKLVLNTGIFRHTHAERSKWTSRGSNNWLSRIRYDEENLMGKIHHFYQNHNRIPTKREFYNNWQAFRRIFGSWNKAIVAAGYIPNSERFSKKFTAKDGHVCDSLSEKIIDDWFTARRIEHTVHEYYPGQKRFKVDFLVKDKYWVEFLGLKGQLKSYDKLFVVKKQLAKKLGINILEIYPEDLKNLGDKLNFTEVDFT